MKTLSLKQVGHLLGSRILGQTVRQQIEALREENPSEDITIDFEGVDMITVSFADEAFAKLAPRTDRKSRSRLTFVNHNETITAVLAYALGRRARKPAASTGFLHRLAGSHR
jgi:hypothetical protein